MHSPIEESLLDRLQRLDDAGERRTLETNRLPQGVDIDIDGQRCTNFCSNDYLGFASHPRICEALKEGVDRYGVGAGAAALLSGRCEAHVALENAIATYLGRQRALIFSSGYMANLAFASALISRDDVIFHDRLNHASLIDSVRLSGATHRRYPHKDIKALELMLSQATKKRRWIITDALFSMDGDLAPLSALADLAEGHCWCEKHGGANDDQHELRCGFGKKSETQGDTNNHEGELAALPEK